MCFSAVMLVPVTYYIGMAIWIPRKILDRVQYLIGLPIYLVCGPFINIIVLFYAILNVDSFGWGKTRKVVAEVAPPQHTTAMLSSDEEANIGIERPPRSASLQRDMVAIVGRDRSALELYSTFCKRYRTILYGPNEKTLSLLYREASSMGLSEVEMTSNAEQLTAAKIFLIVPWKEKHGTEELTTEGIQALLSPHISAGDIVMVDGTVTATADKARALLENFERRGAFCGFSPSRSSPDGSKIFTSTKKVIAAMNEASLPQVETVYRRTFSNVVSVATPEVAEFLCLLDATALDESQPQDCAKMLQASLESITARRKPAHDRQHEHEQSEQDTPLSEKVGL
jgi:hypothetical protein